MPKPMTIITVFANIISMYMISKCWSLKFVIKRPNYCFSIAKAEEQVNPEQK